MAEHADRLVIDCSLSAPPDPDAIAAMEEDAMALVRAGEIDKARNVLDQIERVRADASQPREEYVPLSDEEIAQREADVAEERERRTVLVRALRNERLAASDWTQSPDAGLSEAAVAAWRRYRQALRDWPASVKDPLDPPPWPDPPGGG